jgi:hypothetical protein
MKRLLAILIAFTVALSLGSGIKTEAATSTDFWIDRDIKVSEDVYSFLVDYAGFASYIFTDTKVNMHPQNLADFVIEERYDGFFIGRFHEDSNKVLVTEDGLIVAYTPKKVAHTIFSDNRHFKDVQSAVKVFVGPTITKANYINFSSLNSNRAIAYFGDNDEGKLVIPTGAKINNIGYSYTSGQFFLESYYSTIISGALQPGATHSLSKHGRYIDDILVTNKAANTMNIFYESATPISVQGTKSYSMYELANKFSVNAPEVSDEKLEAIQIELLSDVMIRGEEQTVRLTGLYSGGVKKSISTSDVEWTSSKPSVATHSSGKVQAIAAGETTLIARYKNLMATEIIQVQDFKELPPKANVAAGKVWNVKFNGPIDIQTAENIIVMDSNGVVIPVRYHYVNNKSESVIQVIPRKEYIPGKSYTIWVKDVQSLSGKSLKQYTKMDFTIKR